MLCSLVLTGCVKDSVTSVPVPTVNDAEIAADFIDSQIGLKRMMGNVLGAGDIKKAIEEQPDQIKVIDLRSAKAFADGHIKGAVNIRPDSLIEYYGSNSLMISISSITGRKSFISRDISLVPFNIQ